MQRETYILRRDIERRNHIVGRQFKLVTVQAISSDFPARSVEVGLNQAFEMLSTLKGNIYHPQLLRFYIRRQNSVGMTTKRSLMRVHCV